MYYGKTFKTLEDFKERIIEYIRFYNEERFQKD
ncbi:IS3 family transposase [Tissierella sp. MB52-C2]